MRNYMQDWQLVTTLIGANWEWDEIQVYYSPPARRYFWMEQSGCSCYGWEDPKDEGEWCNGGKQEALRAVTAFESSFHLSEQEKLDAQREVRDFKEAK